MIPIVLLGLIMAYEIFRLVKLDEYLVVTNTLESLKGKKKGSKEFVSAGNLFLENKRYISYVLSEYTYLIVLVCLLFTQYWLIALLITIEGVVVHCINMDKSKSIIFIDTAITILIVIVGLILI